MPNDHPLFASPARAFRTRREFLRQVGSGCGLLALASLMDADGLRAAAPDTTVGLNPLAPRQGTLPARAKSVI